MLCMCSFMSPSTVSGNIILLFLSASSVILLLHCELFFGLLGVLRGLRWGRVYAWCGRIINLCCVFCWFFWYNIYHCCWRIIKQNKKEEEEDEKKERKDMVIITTLTLTTTRLVIASRSVFVVLPLCTPRYYMRQLY